MSQGTAEPDRSPVKSGLLFLLVGVVLLLWAWGSWLYRTLAHSNGQTMAGGRQVDATTASSEVVPVLPWFLVVGLFVGLTFIFGTYAAIRVARRYREAASRRRPEATSAEDVWASHKVPGDLDDVD